MLLDTIKSPDKKLKQCLSGLMLSLSLVISPVFAADNIDPEAQKVLRSMTDYLAGLSSFTTKADIGNEVVTLDGQKIQQNSSGRMIMKQPNQFYAHRQAGYAEMELFFDGQMLTMKANHLKAYTQTEEPKTIDQAIKAVSTNLALEIPGADLIYSDAYQELTADLNNSQHLGIAYVNGVECHHLAFRKNQVDWQLWVQTGKKPLPMMYIITTKWLTASPQYSIQFRDWNTSPKINKNQFKFMASKDFKKVDKVIPDETDNLLVE